MYSTRAIVTAVLLPALTFGPGCSALFVNGPPPRHEKLNYFDCTTSVVAPVLDGLMATSYLLMGVDAMSAGSGSSRNSEGLPIMLLGAALGASSIWGFSKTSACREAKDRWQERVEKEDRRPTQPAHPAAPYVSPWERPPSNWQPPAPPAVPPPPPADHRAPPDGGATDAGSD